MSDAIKTLLGLLDRYTIRDQWSIPGGGVTLMMDTVPIDEVRRHIQRSSCAGSFADDCYLLSGAQVRIEATSDHVFVTAEPVTRC